MGVSWQSEATLVLGRTGVVPIEGAGALVFDDVYEAEFDFVYRVVARLAGTSEVEDLVQEVFVVVHRRLGEFRGEARLTTWLFRIAYRTVGAHVRRERLRRRLRELFGREDESSGEHEFSGEALERARRVRAALAELSYEKRSALVLFEVEGMSAQEIADMVAAPLGTVYRRLHEARREFARAYGSGEAER